ncbi:MAG: VCBS repeat-containing protein [Sandaracinaceae bacterium]|nr:VCBS repeat-containing protein [Sandaracinaceae bacterium]
MDKVWATLRTLGILLALWVILVAVALIAGVVPLDGAARPAEAESDGEPAAADAGLAAGDAGAAAAEARDGGASSLEAPTAGEEESPTGGGPARPERWAVCPGSGEPSLAAAQLFGDETPELVVGCADRWEIVSVRGPSRVAVFTAPAAPAGQRARTGGAASGDVDGDGLPDLVLPLMHETPQGASRGGGLFWIPRDGFGGIREPSALAPIAAVDAAVAAIDAQRGAEIVAMNRANALAQLPSEAWVFGGGGAPARLAAVRVGVGGSTVRVGDLDRDGNADLVSLSSGRVGVAFGDGQGAFPRTHGFELPGASEIALGDLDADGGVDLVVLGEGLRWIRGGALEGDGAARRGRSAGGAARALHRRRGRRRQARPRRLGSPAPDGAAPGRRGVVRPGGRAHALRRRARPAPAPRAGSRRRRQRGRPRAARHRLGRRPARARARDERHRRGRDHAERRGDAPARRSAGPARAALTARYGGVRRAVDWRGRTCPIDLAVASRRDRTRRRAARGGARRRESARGLLPAPPAR